MTDVSGIPDLGIPGMGFSNGVLGGNAATGQPAMTADQINRSMWGSFSPQQAQQVLNNNFGNFGQQTSYYSGLGAAYGRAVGPQMPVGTYQQPLSVSAPYDDGAGLNPSTAPNGGEDYTSRIMAALNGGAYNPNTYASQPHLDFSDRFSLAPPVQDGLQPAPQGQLPQGIFDGIFAPTTPTNMSTFNDRFTGLPGTPPDQFVSGAQNTSGLPWWQQTTNPGMANALDMIRAGRGWTVGAQPVGNDPPLSQNINQSIFDVGNASRPDMFNNWQPPAQTPVDYFNMNTQYDGPDGGFGPNPSGSLGGQDMFGNYIPQTAGDSQFANRFAGLGLLSQNAGTPSQYATQPYTTAQDNTFQPGPMPRGFSGLFSADNPNGALPATSPFAARGGTMFR